MTVSSVTSQATKTLKQITEAAVTKPSHPIEIKNYEMLNALGKKLVAMAKKDPAKASGMVDLMEELMSSGKISMNFNTGIMPFAGANAWKSMMNDVKEVLNNNAVKFDDKPLSPLMR